jgi:hypothetical protein
MLGHKKAHKAQNFFSNCFVPCVLYCGQDIFILARIRFDHPYEAGLKRLTSIRYFWINCQNARRFF